MKRLASGILLVLLSSFQPAIGQQQADTVISLTEAKSRLMNYNLGLLASYYEINLAKARVIQARVWNNPYFIFNGDMWNTHRLKTMRINESI